MTTRSPFAGSLQFDTEAWHRAGCPTLESSFVAWQAAEERANTAEAELRETAGELNKTRYELSCWTGEPPEDVWGPAERKVLDAAYAYANRESERRVYELEGNLRAAVTGLFRGEKP